MTKEQLLRYYLGDEVVDLGESIASIHRYSGRCQTCAQWVSLPTAAPGSPGLAFCNGKIRKRQRVGVMISRPPYRGWRRATPAERKTVLHLIQRPASQGAA